VAIEEKGRTFQRRGTSSRLAAKNEVLRDGEFCIERTSGPTDRLKIGDGVSNWNTLDYLGSDDWATSNDDDLVRKSAIESGVTIILDADTRIPTQDENDALQGTDGIPSGSNRYVTSSDSRIHTRLHDIDSVTDHNGVSGATSGNLAIFNGDGLIGDTGIASSDLVTTTWNYDSGWITYPGDGTYRSYVHNLGTKTFTVMLVQAKTTDDIPVSFYGGYYAHDYAPGAYVIHCGFDIYSPDSNQVDMNMQGMGFFIPDSGYRRPGGWSTNTISHIRIMLKV